MRGIFRNKRERRRRAIESAMDSAKRQLELGIDAAGMIIQIFEKKFNIQRGANEPLLSVIARAVGIDLDALRQALRAVREGADPATFPCLCLGGDNPTATALGMLLVLVEKEEGAAV